MKSPKPYQVCANCVMDTTDPGITFDEKGICDQCRDFYSRVLPTWDTGPRGRMQLERTLKHIRLAGHGRDFDCIIGLSGGIDSSYLTHLAKVEFGLRPLVFHVDAGWNSQVAVNNIEKLIDGLGLDLYTVVIDWDEMRDLQLAFIKSGVPHIDVPQDHAFFATMYQFAEKHRVRYILTGGNHSTECIRNPLAWFYYGTDLLHIRDIHRRFGMRPLKTFPFSGVLRHKIYLRYLKGIRVVKPLDYVPYVKADAVKLLTETYGWQSYPQKHFESRFTRFFEGYWLPTKFGFDPRRVQFSSLIVTGQMTRDEALERLRISPYDPETNAQDLRFVATKLGISVDELLSYHASPNKSYRDYKSQRQMFAVGAKIMEWTGLEPRIGKR